LGCQHAVSDLLAGWQRNADCRVQLYRSCTGGVGTGGVLWEEDAGAGYGGMHTYKGGRRPALYAGGMRGAASMHAAVMAT